MKRKLPASALVAGALEELLIQLEHVDFVRQSVPSWWGKVVNQEIALGLILVGMVFLLLREHTHQPEIAAGEREAPPPATASASASASAPTNNSPVFAPVFAPTFTQTNEQKQQQEQTTLSHPQEAELKAELTFASDKVTCIRHDRAVYVTHDLSPPNGVAAVFENKLRDKVLHTPIARRVVARLTFKTSTHEELHINHGTWDNEMTHYQQFKGGEKHRLIIYFWENDMPVALRSYYERSPFDGWRSFRSGMTIYSPRPELIPANWNEVEIALLDGDTTVFHGTFACERDEAGFMRLHQQ